MRRLGHFVASAMVSVALVASSTAAVAQASSLPPAPSTNAWMALSMLTPSGASVLNTTALAAAQPDTTPPPPPPPPTYTGPGTPPIPVILVWLATLGVIIYIATKGNHSVHSNSPA